MSVWDKNPELGSLNCMVLSYEIPREREVFVYQRSSMALLLGQASHHFLLLSYRIPDETVARAGIDLERPLTVHNGGQFLGVHMIKWRGTKEIDIDKTISILVPIMG